MRAPLLIDISRRVGRAAIALSTLTVLAACASTGATFRSGVGDAMLEHPPYYAGASRVAVARSEARIAHLPIAYQRGAAQDQLFDPRDGEGSAVAALLAEMNVYLDSLAGAQRASYPMALEYAVDGREIVAPDVRFGCMTTPGDDCPARGDSALGRGYQAMRLAVGRPSKGWVRELRGASARSGAERALVITLEVGQYLPRQVGWRGDKVVELGTGNVARLPWLTSLETPVMVLQLTGALVDRDGKAIRIGAEGFMARRTNLLVSAIGAQELLSDADVARARTLRRDDLPGDPLAWRVALRNLVAQLTGRIDGGAVVAAR